MEVGQQVARGEELGEVGSSGNSTDAHLHFGVFQNGVAIETYLEPERWWLTPLPYSGDVPGVLDHGLTDFVPVNAALREPAAHQDIFDVATDLVFFWVHLHGVSTGDALTFHWFAPDQRLVHTIDQVTPQIRYGWRVAGLPLPQQPFIGTWEVFFELNGEELAREEFQAVPEPSPSAVGMFALATVFVLAGRKRPPPRHRPRHPGVAGAEGGVSAQGLRTPTGLAPVSRSPGEEPRRQRRRMGGKNTPRPSGACCVTETLLRLERTPTPSGASEASAS